MKDHQSWQSEKEKIIGGHSLQYNPIIKRRPFTRMASGLRLAFRPLHLGTKMQLGECGYLLSPQRYSPLYASGDALITAERNLSKRLLVTENTIRIASRLWGTWAYDVSFKSVTMLKPPPKGKKEELRVGGINTLAHLGSYPHCDQPGGCTRSDDHDTLLYYTYWKV